MLGPEAADGEDSDEPDVPDVFERADGACVAGVTAEKMLAMMATSHCAWFPFGACTTHGGRRRGTAAACRLILEVAFTER